MARLLPPLQATPQRPTLTTACYLADFDYLHSLPLDKAQEKELNALRYRRWLLEQRWGPSENGEGKWWPPTSEHESVELMLSLEALVNDYKDFAVRHGLIDIDSLPPADVDTVTLPGLYAYLQSFALLDASLAELILAVRKCYLAARRLGVLPTNAPIPGDGLSSWLPAGCRELLTELRQLVSQALQREPAPEKSAGSSASAIEDKPALEPPAAIPQLEHGPGFRSVRWGKKEFTFTTMQAAVVQALWEAREMGIPDISALDLLDKAGSARVDADGKDLPRLRDLFRNKEGKQAFGTLIISSPGRRGLYRLAEPPV